MQRAFMAAGPAVPAEVRDLQEASGSRREGQCARDCLDALPEFRRRRRRRSTVHGRAVRGQLFTMRARCASHSCASNSAARALLRGYVYGDMDGCTRFADKLAGRLRRASPGRRSAAKTAPRHAAMTSRSFCAASNRKAAFGLEPVPAASKDTLIRPPVAAHG